MHKRNWFDGINERGLRGKGKIRNPNISFLSRGVKAENDDGMEEEEDFIFIK